jgi:hypothetical protein
VSTEPNTPELPPEVFNVYCDESCHLENDHQKAMVLGALWCPASTTAKLSDGIRQIKIAHHFDRRFEIKWTKVSAGKVEFYLDLVRFFFASSSLHFRAVIIADKAKLRHEEHQQTHDDWYYKMHFRLLENLLNPKARYHIFIDIKDNWGGRKVDHLRTVLSNNLYDFSQTIVEQIQIIRSEESELLQLSDLLIGAVSYVNRQLWENPGKLQVIAEIRRLSGYRLTHTTLLREDKLNLFRWAPWEMRV